MKIIVFVTRLLLLPELLEHVSVDSLDGRKVAEDDLHVLVVEQSPALLAGVLSLLGDLGENVQHSHIVALRGHQLVEHLAASTFPNIKIWSCPTCRLRDAPQEEF